MCLQNYPQDGTTAEHNFLRYLALYLFYIWFILSQICPQNLFWKYDFLLLFFYSVISDHIIVSFVLCKKSQAIEFQKIQD